MKKNVGVTNLQYIRKTIKNATEWFAKKTAKQIDYI